MIPTLAAGMAVEEKYMRIALRLARRGYGGVSPNPMVGALVVNRGLTIGQGWHRRAGGPHAEIEAIADAESSGQSVRGATLYVTLEPCSTHGRTPPCTDAVLAAGIHRVIVGSVDPNPKHAGRGLELLRRAGVEVIGGVLEEDCTRLNETFNHWIVHRTPFVTLKAAMTLDGKIATASGESKWITGPKARAESMRLRQGADAILVGINTVLLDDPSLTIRPAASPPASTARNVSGHPGLRRIVLDSRARTPPHARVTSDASAALTTIVVGPQAPKPRVERLSRRVRVLICPRTAESQGRIDLDWLLRRLGEENVTSLLVEGGGEVNASFLRAGFVHRVVFFYAPKILGGRRSRHAVEGQGAETLAGVSRIIAPLWRRVGEDLMLTGYIRPATGSQVNPAGSLRASPHPDTGCWSARLPRID